MVYQKSESLILKKRNQKIPNLIIKRSREIRLLELRTLLEKEKTINDANTCFLSMASHEFKTPLSSILSSIFLIEKYTELIETKNEKVYIVEREKHLSKIKKTIHHLTETLNNFLSIDKLDQGEIKVKPEETNLKLFSEDILDEIKSLLKNGQKIAYTYYGDEIIHLDKNILRNIYLNLLSNAIKYSGTDKEIHLDIKVRKNDIIIQVIDQGIGIAESEQEKLFTRFFRANNVQQTEGSGLGLHIVKQYVELIHGKISFSSKPNKGTTFKITFPKN